MKIQQVDNYLNARGDEAFAIAAIEAWLEDGEVDWENEIIKDPSFIGTKSECVLDELISTNNNIYTQVIDTFTEENSEFRIKFTVEQSNVGGGEAHTSLPNDNGIITIKIDPDVVNGNAIDLARIIFHETIHAELHRIKFSNNSGPDPFPQVQYEWFLDMWEVFENDYNGNQNNAATAAEHNFMAVNYINAIASGLRIFDNHTHSLQNYKGFAWIGLQDFGKDLGYITQAELNNLTALSQIIYVDNNFNNCD